MMRAFHVSWFSVMTWGLLPAASVWSQGPAQDAQNKLLARRAAEADCYRKLAEIVYGLELTSETYVRDFVTESDEIRTGVDAFVKGIKLGPPSYYEDGTCEVAGEVVVSKLVTRLKRIHTEHYKGRSVSTTDIEQITKTFAKEVIRATGSGVPRPDLSPNLPEGIEAVITPLPAAAATVVMRLPPIWKVVGPQARLMAERAARIDAQRKLLERIKGLRLTSDTLVRDFITESDEISARAQGLVVGASQVGRPYLHENELIVEVTMEVPVEKIVTRIKEFHSEHYHGRRVTTTDITNVKKIIKRQMITAVGSGVPPRRFAERIGGAGYSMPGWFTDQLSATGQGTDEAIDTAQGKLRAARAAELDAMRKLAERIYGLQISSNTTVRDFVTDYDEVAGQVQGVLSGAVAGAPIFANGVAEVKVSILASEVWSVVHGHMLIIERKG